MVRLVQIGAVLLIVFYVATASASDTVPRANKVLGIGIWLMDGQFLGAYHLEQVNALDQSARPLPTFYYVHYVWDGTYLKVRTEPEAQRAWSQAALDKDGWYVTADYTAMPPRVIVTKEPTKHSQWRFVAATQKAHYYIKNENAEGNDAWLNLNEDTSQRYSFVDKGLSNAEGIMPERFWKGSVYRAVLSSERRKFFVNDIEFDGGK
jgi:hypothetical protein